MTQPIPTIRRFRPLAVLACLLIAIFAFIHPASAHSKQGLNQSASLTIDASMTHDPEALACMINVCRHASRTQLVGETGASEYDMQKRACQSQHYERVRNTWEQKPKNPLLKAPQAGEDVRLTNELTRCEMLAGPKTDPIRAADEAWEDVLEDKLHTAEIEKAKLIAQGPPPETPVVEPKQVEPPVPPPATPKRPAPVAVAKRVASSKTATPPDSSGGRVPSATGGGECSLPSNFSLVSVEADKMTVFVSHGADFGGLTRSSCISSTYETDAKKVVESNKVEVTIPYCADGAHLVFSPSRVGDILSGKTKLVLGGPPDVAFLDQCVRDGKRVGTALQERQRLVLYKRSAKTDAAPAPKEAKDSSHETVPTNDDVHESSAEPTVEPVDSDAGAMLLPSPQNFSAGGQRLLVVSSIRHLPNHPFFVPATAMRVIGTPVPLWGGFFVF